MVGGSILVHGVPPVHHAVAAAAAGSGMGALAQMLLEALVGILAGGLIVGAVAVGGRVLRSKAA
jgi:predicted DNA repair protein MutK